MSTIDDLLPGKSRLAVLRDHFALFPDSRNARRLPPLPAKILLLAWGTMAAWGTAHPVRQAKADSQPHRCGATALHLAALTA